MGKPTGFLEYERKDGPVTAPKERIKNFKEDTVTWIRRFCGQ